MNAQSWRRILAAAALLLCGLVSPVRGLTVQEVLWGFDGQVVPDRINLLSLLVVNDTGTPFSGTLELYRTDGLKPVGASEVQDCFLAPFGTRWVQFYTHNSGENEEWILRWGRGLRQSMELTVPRLGAPARVLLNDPGDPFARSGSLKAFPEDIFPVTVAATDALESIVMDHAPRWEPVRRQAFLDWLRRGGTVHVLLGRSGRTPEFPSDLAVLNTAVDRFRVGAGLVVRHDVSRSGIDDQTLTDRGFPRLRLEKLEEWNSIAKVEDPFFTRLRSFTRAKHHWWLIYPYIILYIVLIGPVNYLLGRKWRDYRLTLLFFVGVMAFSAVFLEWVGRRGHGESAAVHTLSYARPVADGVYDVTQWVNAFVTRGAYYKIQHDAPHSLYTTGQDMESVNGVIQNGPDGTFTVDMPLYSWRSFVHRGKMKGPDLGLKLAKWSAGSGPEELVVACGPDFPKEVLGAWALSGDNFYKLQADGRQLELVSPPQGKSKEEFLVSDQSFHGLPFMPFGGPAEDDTELDTKASYEKMVPALVAYGLGGAKDFRYRVSGEARSRDSLQVFIVARCPESFFIREKPFGRETGYVLYHVCFFESNR